MTAAPSSIALAEPPRRRFRGARFVIVAVLGVLALRVGWLTTARGEELRAAADRNLVSMRRLEAPRGNIYDARGVPLALSRKLYTLTFSRYGQSADTVRTTLRALSTTIPGLDAETRAEEILAARPSWTRHELAKDLEQDQVVALLERPQGFPGARLEAAYRREYHGGPAIAPVVGHMGRIPAGKEADYPEDIYRPDAWVGRAGLERRYERELASKPGRESVKKNARGMALEDPDVARPAQPGDDLHLTLDLAAQETAYRLLAGVRGSVVVLNAQTGAIRVLASSPSFDPDQPGRQELDGRPVSYLNRAAQGLYPPASTFKIVSASAWLRAGHSPGETQYCPGSLTLPGWDRPFRCDGRHGTVALPQSLRSSCNVYYFEAARTLGGAAIQAEAARFGFGRTTGVDLDGERAGSLGQESPGIGESLNVAIGQGALQVTPLQVAVAYAALANGGELVTPYILERRVPADGTILTASPQTQGRVSIAPDHRAAILRGLRDVVADPQGTAHRAGFDPAWEVYGKTGTAENGQGGTDAWFAGFYPGSRPRWIVVAVAEEAGHGGDTAAPIARGVIEQMEQTDREEPDLAQR